MKNYIQPGKILSATVAANVKSGDIVTIGSISGIAVTDANAGDQLEICTSGVFALPKPATDDIGFGDLLYVKDNKLTKKKEAGAIAFGVAVSAGGQGVATINVKLQSFVA